ncbi:MAG: TldD/PmbA family protein [Candidatus Lokiarchaeota archaeon]|nr:TldD/PmbA family protein [Candidatus Lokiarchaeota archaeon]
MSNEKLDLIEKRLKLKDVKEYEIFLIERKAYESIFLKDKVDNEREVNDFDYLLRILSQKNEKTGIGLVKGNSLDLNEIDRNIETCILTAKNNLGSKYYFPNKKKIQNVSISDEKILQDPLGIKIDLAEELIAEIKQQKDVKPTFGRFRVHIDEHFLRNSNAIDSNSLKTYFFIEFSLKAQENGKLAEYWPFQFIKERQFLNFPERVKKWSILAQDTLKAYPPKPNNKATIIFSPQILSRAINPVIGTHASGKAYHQGISRFQVDEKLVSENITIIDDGLLEGGFNTMGWDSEGSPHQRNEIIKKGIFQKRLYDQKDAIIGNEESTGNGVRALHGSVETGISNLEILPGDMSLDEIISEIKEGYYVEQFSWLRPSKLSGNFGAEIRNGYYIKNGKFENPIKHGNISGNILKMIRSCLYLSKEREYFVNTLFPYMVFENLTVSS